MNCLLADSLPGYTIVVGFSSLLRFHSFLWEKVEYWEGQEKYQFKIKEILKHDYWIVSWGGMETRIC